MKTIRMTVPKVHCIKKNDRILGVSLNKDKVYLVAIVTATTVDETPKIIFSAISGISKFKKDARKELNLGTEWKFNVEENQVFNVTFGLYDMDKGDVYDVYQQKITEIVDTEGVELNDVIAQLWEAIKDKITNLSISDLVAVLPTIGIKIIEELRKDDLLGKRSISFKANNQKDYELPLEYDLTDNNSHYKVSLQFKTI